MKHVFIVTYGRSGSTLLQRALNSVPGYTIRGENKNALFGLFRSVQALGEAQLLHRRNIELPPKHPYYGITEVNCASYQRALIEAFVSHVLRPPPTARAVGFKEISWFLDQSAFSRFMDFVLTAFPNAQIVFNVRDPCATAASGWWANRNRAETVEAIGSYARKMRAFDASCEQSILVDYDAYSDDPCALAPLFEFLGEEFDIDKIAEIFSERLRH